MREDQLTLGNLLTLDEETRNALWRELGHAIERYLSEIAELDVVPQADAAVVREFVAGFDFCKPAEPQEALRRAIEGMRSFQPHVRHPRHFGLFDPAPTTMGILADSLASAFNPCLASWDGSPFGVATESYLVSAFARRFGYAARDADGIVTTGGSEANMTALLLALTAAVPGHHEHGVRVMPRHPVVYVTTESHPSFRKSASIVGLGSDSIRDVPVDGSLRMDPMALDTTIRRDQEAGLMPMMVAATAGTTGTGAIDPIAGIAEIADRHRLWLHVDAAWGGAAILLPEFAGEFGGIERSDSITFDPHKWLSVPMGCGLLLTRHGSLLGQAFGVEASFLPDTGDEGGPPPDPSARSLRWSRGFGGLKLLLSLAVAGWDGYRDAIRRHVRLADQLRGMLRDDGWTVVNETPLPVVCFVPGDGMAVDGIAHAVNGSGKARIFVVHAGGRNVLRAAVTSHMTSERDLGILLAALRMAREGRVNPGWSGPSCG